MTCPVCGERTRIVNSRSYSDGEGVRRRRECLTCGHRFTTIELDADMRRNVVNIPQRLTKMKEA